jgi:hypothetical protein
MILGSPVLLKIAAVDHFSVQFIDTVTSALRAATVVGTAVAGQASCSSNRDETHAATTGILA